jgi:hypothetical protein
MLGVYGVEIPQVPSSVLWAHCAHLLDSLLCGVNSNLEGVSNECALPFAHVWHDVNSV